MDESKNNTNNDNNNNDSIRSKLKYYNKYKIMYQINKLHSKNQKLISKIINMLNNKVICLIVICMLINIVHSKPIQDKNNQNKTSSRSGRALYYANANPLDEFNDIYNDDNNNYNENEDNYDYNEDISSRSNSKKHNNKKKYADSPIYYIKMPATPYVHVPGYGYISQTGNLKPPPIVHEQDQHHNQNKNKYQHNSNLDSFMSNLIGTSSTPQQQDYIPNNPGYNTPSYVDNNPNYIQDAQSYIPQTNYMSPAIPQPSLPYMNYLQSSSNAIPNTFMPQSFTSNLQYQTDSIYPANTFPLNNGFQSNGFHNKYSSKYPDSPIHYLDKGPYTFNGKPQHIYTVPNEIQKPPKRPLHQSGTNNNLPDSPIYHLDKGPYVFNGKPLNHVMLLRDSFNALYDEAISSFYP